MELADAYRVLEIAAGASKDQAREARNVLAKVWHPDRHQGDPQVHDRADRKLREINEAYKFLETAGFPRVEFAQREAPPAYVDSLTRRPHSTPPTTEVVHDELPRRRRVRLWVPFALGAVVAAGAIAFVMHEKPTAAPTAPTTIVTPTPTPPTPTPNTTGFTLGSSREAVRKIMGEPTSIDQTFGERWAYGMAEVSFRHGLVYGWRSSAFDKLKVSLAPTDPKVADAAHARGTYGRHATRDEVLGVEGAPDGIDDSFGETWTFGLSHLTFDENGHINEVWDTHFRPLHIAK